ncbi:hypothetical protein [Luteibacter sp. dw_328]|uniref:hypothetical protein n=1 Tax=Luteibacter sp. dw_328 TaxID=2719796 RepID=UPI001BD57E72|nr:hypothetical protein [Luteibacter sp. dw_328]
MHSLLIAVFALATPHAMPVDACAASVPDALRQALERQFRDVRLPLETDSPLEDRKAVVASGRACLLIASADFNGDGRNDLVLLLPRKASPGYRLVVALDSPSGFRVTSLQSSATPMTNMFLDAAPAGTYSHTEAYELRPSPGAAERIVSAQAGFWFGGLGAAADVYFLKQGRWLHVHAVD